MLSVQLNGQQRDLRIGDEGTLWYWDGGQRTVCLGDRAAQWLLEHLPPSDARDRAAEMIRSKEINRRRRIGIYANPFRRGVRSYGSAAIRE